MPTFECSVLLLIAALCCQSCCLIIHFGAVTRRCNYVTSGGGKAIKLRKGELLESLAVCNNDLSPGNRRWFSAIISCNNFLYTTVQCSYLQISCLKSTATFHLLYCTGGNLVSHKRKCIQFQEDTTAWNLRLWSSVMSFRNHLPDYTVSHPEKSS